MHRLRQSRKLRACTNCRQQLQPQAAALSASTQRLSTDLNQLLGRLMEVAEELAGPLHERHPLGDVFSGLMKATLDASRMQRGASTLEQALHPVWVAPIDLTVLLREALRLVEPTLPPGTSLQSHIGSGIWALGKTGLLKQVLLDLLLTLTQDVAMDDLKVSLEERASRLDRVTGWDVGPGRHAELTLQGALVAGPAAGEEAATERLRSAVERAMAALSGVAGARVEVEGAGRTWQIRLLLPCGLGRSPSEGDEEPESLQGSEHVLIVASDPLTPRLAKWGLEPLGYRVTTHTSPIEALEAFRSRPEDVDLVLFDLVLPRMSGIDLAHRLKHLRRDVPLILMTEAQLASSHLLGLHTELRDVLHKPFTVLELATVIRRHATPAEPQPEVLRREPRVSRPTVLLAEDSSVTRAMIRTWLTEDDFIVVDARDGQAAWESYQQRTGRGESFDLVLTDVVMPRLDGLALAGRIRATDSGLPIVVMTTAEDRDTMRSALTAGVNDFLNKPFDHEVLRACVKRLLSSTGQRAETRRNVQTAQAVRMAQKALLAVAEKDLPLYTLYEPLTDAGGDIFRASRLEDGRIFFVLGDVAGHSVISSYAVASFLGMLSTFSSQAPSLSTLAHRLNQGIQDGPFAEVPVCTLLGLWNPANGRVELLNAGIPHGLVYRAGRGIAHPIPLNGAPLGILPDPPMEETVVHLAPGDRLLFATDGFFEVRSANQRPFEDEVPHQWAQLKDTPVQWALSLICEAARAHGEGVLADDLLVLGLEQPPWSPVDEEFLRCLPSLASEIDEAIHEFKGFLDRSDTGRSFDPTRRFEIVLTLREALTNALFHGNRAEPEARVTVHARFLDGPPRLQVRVSDEGLGFPMEALEPPMEPDSERGRGIPLIRHFAQAVHMAGSELCMTFDPEGPAHDDPAIPR